MGNRVFGVYLVLPVVCLVLYSLGFVPLWILVVPAVVDLFIDLVNKRKRTIQAPNATHRSNKPD